MEENSREDYSDILKKFQCDHNRDIEESFARAFAENDDVNLFFINEDSAYTDGKNIVVDPAFLDIYKDKECLEGTEKKLSWPSLISSNPWTALKMVTRGLTLHECLHLLYTNFPGNEFKDPDFMENKNGRKVISNISNIIEDAYIEAVGASVYDNIGIYLMFNRVAVYLAKKETEETARKKMDLLLEYLNYMCGFLLFPMFEIGDPPEEIKEYVDKTRQLFLDGSVQAEPDDRYTYCKKIYEVIKPLVPEDEEIQLPEDILPKIVAGKESHNGTNNSIGGQERKGKPQVVITRLFGNIDGTPKNNVDTDVPTLVIAVKGFGQDEKEADDITGYQGYHIQHTSASVGATPLHKNIKINENHPKINLNLRKAYQNIYNQYRLNINSYNSRFLQLLRAQVPVKENKFPFGTGIDSRRLGDIKRRFWFRILPGIEIPDMSVLLLIDGSGSMYQERRDSAMVSCVILHEVLKKQGIEHAIVEHRAHFKDPEIDVNILVDFNARENEKLNIMQLDADGDNRDGLALYWAEKYINSKTSCDNKLIIVISDGQPAHEYDEYYGPVADKDTANATKKIMSRGTNIIAISLDDEDEYNTYDNLKNIYPNLIACNNLKRLTGQLLQVISRQLQ
jgi:uncharacterized protein YegL